MKEKCYMVLYLVLFSYLIISAVIMFGNGFLLSRKTLSDTSECLELSQFDCDGREIEKSSDETTCNELEKIKRIISNPGAPMVCAKTKNRVVFLLVDALRYDFTEYDPSIESPLYYQNRLPIIREVLEKWPERARLYRFMADPPTTTFQRVKALATGSLPTFIDVTSNFAVMELQEDNFVDQVIKGDGKVVLLGDDTWARLLPGKWKRSHALYSFHTWDLDTVDMEVDSKIYDELKADDWELLIAHYLGVDHAGHRYGPNHPEMARKLDETNVRIKKIIETLPKDVVLYVVGDHGMTETGDHGGESKAERTAALFAYRGSGLGGAAGAAGGAAGAAGGAAGGAAQQTDLAATLAAALGRPPPAPSLGGLLLPVLPPAPRHHALMQITNNLKQLNQYLVRYGEESQQVPLEKLTRWINSSREHIELAAGVGSDLDLDKYVEDVRSLVVNIKNVFRSVWVEFDSAWMQRGLLLLLLCVFLHGLLEAVPSERLPAVFRSSFVPTAVTVAAGAAACGALVAKSQQHPVAPAAMLLSGLAAGAAVSVLIVLHWDGIAKRWHESRAPFYERFARSCLVASAAVLLSNSFIIEEGATLAFLSLSVAAAVAWRVRTWRALGLWLVLALSLLLTRGYRGCREEQGACWLARAAAEPGRGALVAALASVGALAAVGRRSIPPAGGVALVAMGVLICAHWALGFRGLGSAARSKLLARLSWAAGGAGLLLCARRGGGAGPALLQLLLLWCSLCALLLGARLAPVAPLALLAGAAGLQLLADLRDAAHYKYGAACSLWALLSLYWFYGGGHHATLAHVRWQPAFHAGDPQRAAWPVGGAGHAVAAALVAGDLFGLQFMYGVAVPLLALWGEQGAWGPHSARGPLGTRGPQSARGPRAQAAAVFEVCLKFGLCFALRMLFMLVSCTVHCRHLMVWGVFTPKLLFEVGGGAAALAGAAVGAALAMWQLRGARGAAS